MLRHPVPFSPRTFRNCRLSLCHGASWRMGIGGPPQLCEPRDERVRGDGGADTGPVALRRRGHVWDYRSLGNRRLCPRCRSEEHTSELQSRGHLVCRLLLEKKKKKRKREVR